MYAGASRGGKATSSGPPKQPTSDSQRAYKACIPCRTRKAKCDLAGNDRPPCVRCRREMRECIFSSERAWNSKRQKTDGGGLHGLEAQTTDMQQSQDEDNLGRPSHADTSPAHLPMPFGDTQRLTRRPPPPQNDTTSSRIERSGTSMSAYPSAANEWIPSTGQGQSAGLMSSVMRTVVSNGNDALRILFEAATEDAGAGNINQDHAAQDARHVEFATSATPGSGTSPAASPHVAPPVILSTTDPNTLRAWNACRFVRMGWLSAEEAVTYVDLFFRNMWPFSPILTDRYSHHETHLELVSQEPLLCCTILMISSRYHLLPGPASASRSFFIHHRLWQHVSHLIMRIMFGQEKGSIAKTRTVGSIEALILMTEWHPRSIHFPPEADGWDSHMILTSEEDELRFARPKTAASKWLEDVVDPAKRSDRMSWMILGCALTLGYELDIFDEENATIQTTGDPLRLRKARLVRLLYVFINQLASRLGYSSPLPSTINHLKSGNLQPSADTRWSLFMNAWTDLTKLFKSFSEMVFPSAIITKQLLHSGRYLNMLEHFSPLLQKWKSKHLDQSCTEDVLQRILFIEYQYIRIYCNSLGMQAVCERRVNDTDDNSILEAALDPVNQAFIQEVIHGSCDVLNKVIGLAEDELLRYAPVRIYLRITTSSIFLLKAISLGIRDSQMRKTLDVLERSIRALRRSTLDDMHLASRYATLLEMHLTRLRRHFASASRASRASFPGTRRSSPQPDQIQSASRAMPSDKQGVYAGSLQDFSQVLGDIDFSLPDAFDDAWLSLPFDPSMAPFNNNLTETAAPPFDWENLDFIWNLPE